jgi:hypothetical protein
MDEGRLPFGVSVEFIFIWAINNSLPYEGANQIMLHSSSCTAQQFSKFHARSSFACSLMIAAHITHRPLRDPVADYQQVGEPWVRTTTSVRLDLITNLAAVRRFGRTKIMRSALPTCAGHAGCERLIELDSGAQAYTTHPTFRKNTPVLKIAKPIRDKSAISRQKISDQPK